MRKDLVRNRVLGVGALFVAGASACTSASQGSPGGGNEVDVNATFGNGGSAGASDATFGDAGGGPALPKGNGGSSPANGGAGGGNLCGGEVTKATASQLDLYLMVDQSGSMSQPTNGGQTKWDALGSALGAFLGDNGSAGLGVGLQFFPYAEPGVPEFCKTGSNDCGAKGGKCQAIRVCNDSIGTVSPCSSDNDCLFGGSCVPLGTCSKPAADGSAYICFYGETQGCTSLDGNFGTCQGPMGQCTGAYSCNEADYASPDAAIAPLPGARDALLAKLAAHMPGGDTPTGPALQGALDYAGTWSTQHPDHTVAVLLATDGVPSSTCSTTDISQIAAEATKAAAGKPKIETFVIGIFGDQDIAAGADKSLDVIADAGGTGQKAFIIQTSNGNTETQLLAALDAIRKASLSCTYTLPATDQNGAAVHYDQVNLVFSNNGQAPQAVTYVGDAAHCDATTGGWYYDVDPAKGTPTKILTCPTTCDTFRMVTAGEVDVQLRCPTQMIPPVH